MALQTTMFATAQEMADRSEGAIPATHPFLEKELKAATRLIRNHCRWHVAQVEALTYRRVGPFADRVWLPAMQVQSVTKVVVDGTTWDTPAALASVEFDPDTGWTNLCGRHVAVEFTAGFDEIPEDLVTLTLQVAARALGSPLGHVREQAGTVSVTHSQSGFNIAGGDVLLPPEKDGLAAYKLGWVP